MTDSADPRNWTAQRLAATAECGGPQAPDSPGARFLTRVRDAVIEEWEYLGPRPDRRDAVLADLPDVLDACMPVYTSDLWATFVDLAAYDEDLDDLGVGASDASTMTTLAGACLYAIAERVATAVLDALDTAPQYLLVLDTTYVPGALAVVDAADGQPVAEVGQVEWRTDGAGAPTDDTYAAAVAAARAAGWATAGGWDVTPDGDGYALAVERA